MVIILLPKGRGMEANMNVNGISSAASAYSTYNTSAAKTKTDTSAKSTDKAADSGVIYEKSSSVDRNALVAKMKADSEQRINQLKSLVEDLMTTQAGKANNLADLYRNLNPDAETIKKAQEEISEDGYWGVKQTSERIFEFAKALSGGDDDKMEEMLEAFKKGFEQATKAWGEELPGISGDTYDAVLERFEAYKNRATEEVEA